MAEQTTNVRISDPPFMVHMESVMRDTGHIVNWDLVPAAEAAYLAQDGKSKRIPAGTPMAKDGTNGLFPIPYYRLEVAAAGLTATRVNATTINLQKTGIRATIPNYADVLPVDVYVNIFPLDSGSHHIQTGAVAVSLSAVDADNIRLTFSGADAIPDPLPTLEDPIIIEPKFFGLLVSSAVMGDKTEAKTGYGVFIGGNVLYSLLPWTMDTDFEKANIVANAEGRFAFTPYVDQRT